MFDDDIRLDDEQQAFAAQGTTQGAIGVIGPAGSGKTRALLAHLQTHTESLDPAANILLLSTADPTPLGDMFSEHVEPETFAQCIISTPLEFAQECLRTGYGEFGFAEPPVLLDDRAALAHFVEIAQPLCHLEWPALRNGELDPEVSGIRNPERFLATTWRLFERLRAANVDPLQIGELGLRGTTMFYAAPPNFADAELIRATKETYRDSLRVDYRELDHQRRREADLTAVVAQLARDQFADTQNYRVFSPQQALAQLTETLEGSAELRRQFRRRFAYVYLDEAQDVSALEQRLFTAIYGAEWCGMALAGDPDASTRGYGSAQSNSPFARVKEITTLQHRYRGTPVIWTTHGTALAPIQGPQMPHPTDANAAPSVNVFRAPDRATEAATIAEAVKTAIAQGNPPQACAILLRSLSCAAQYIDALLDLGLPVDIAGAIDPLLDKRTADIFALLQALTDRNNSAAFLRIAASKLLAANDRDIAVLCTSPGEPTLFALDPSARTRTPKQPDLLAANLLDGLQDTAFDSEMQKRLATLRRQWMYWQDLLAQSDDLEVIRKVIRQSGLLCGNSVRARFARSMTTRLVTQIHQLQTDSAEPRTLAQALCRYTALAKFDIEAPSCSPIDRGAIIVASVEAVRGYEFDFVAIADARAGAFPRYYVPEAFLFSPSRGFVPRENVATQGAQRTAKFTWYIHVVRARDGYNREERRIFASAIARANRQLFISASGAATRGITAPELLEEIRRAGIHGARDLNKNIR